MFCLLWLSSWALGPSAGWLLPLGWINCVLYLFKILKSSADRTCFIFREKIFRWASSFRSPLEQECLKHCVIKWIATTSSQRLLEFSERFGKWPAVMYYIRCCNKYHYPCKYFTSSVMLNLSASVLRIQIITTILSPYDGAAYLVCIFTYG